MTMKRSAACAAAAALLATTQLVEPARADPAAVSFAVTPAEVRPGDPVLVTVSGSVQTPRGKAEGKPLVFYATSGGHQAVFAVPVQRAPGELKVSLRGLPPQTIQVVEYQFAAADVQVPDEYANPTPEQQARVHEDNRAIRKSFARASGPPLFRREFSFPNKGRPTSPFGEMRTFNGVAKSRHLGLDLAAREGSPVKAIDDGTVVLVRDCFLPGNVVVVSHGAGIASAYFHLSETAVAEGDVLERGAVVGKAGKTGRATGPHIHLSVWVPGGFVAPNAFLLLGLQPPADAAVAAGSGEAEAGAESKAEAEEAAPKPASASKSKSTPSKSKSKSTAKPKSTSKSRSTSKSKSESESESKADSDSESAGE